MKKNKKINYSIGLDIGTSSVGWAVTNENGDLQRFKGKLMLGSSLFESAKTASERRGFRNTRRRLKRRQIRIENLQSLTSEEMNKIDPLFFRKMEESKLFPEDKTIDPLNLQLLLGKWDGKECIDKNQFKTIFHLRNYLMETGEKVDFRLVYLALHHAIKYRGNFLYQEMENFSVEKGLYDSIEEFLITLSNSENYQEYDEKMIKDNTMEIEKIIVDKSIKNSAKVEKLEELIVKLVKEEDKSKKKAKTAAISKAIIGFSADYTKIFEIEGEEKINFKLSEEKAATELEGRLNEEDENIYIALRNVYSAHLLNEILKGEKSISKAMIRKYDDHKNDLNILKKLIKENFKNIYNEIFRKEKSLYEQYIKNTSKTGLTQENFYVELKKILENKKEELKDNKDYIYCMDKIKDETFLLKLNTTDNGAIPFQLHLNEVEKIIKNQSVYYPELEKNKDKIMSILTFRIPYYVGPLNSKSDFAWIEKSKNEKIKPWNFSEVIDLEKSAEKFIEKMRNNCTYLSKEHVIPKNSLLYSEFTVLNELNKISIGGKLISIETKQYVLEELFKENKSISKKKLQDKLREHKHLTPDAEITGFQKENAFASSLTSYIDFKKILGKVDSSNYKMIEKIILWITLFEDRKLLKKRINKEYPELTPEQLKSICKLKYKGWSRLSEKLLSGLKSTGNIEKFKYPLLGKNIIEIMRETNENFMQIIERKELGFGELIEKENSNRGLKEKITYDDVKELPGSPALKKGIWHTVKVIKEIVGIMGCNPKNIYLEVTREDQAKGKRTNSRYNALKKIYDSIESDVEEYKTSLKELKGYDKSPKELDNERLYLYFIQNGKCMYTGEHLDINFLSNYDVDHILPQSYIKDDSFNNKVLVKSKDNRRKNDILLLKEDVINKNKTMWLKLLKSGLMTTQKYNRLTRIYITDEEKSKFIARQLVETSQIIKNVVNMLKIEFKDGETKINLIKSNLVSNLRKQYKLYKHRDLNDFHHAHDAYFLCALGTFVENCYPKLFEKEFNYEGYRKDYEKSIKAEENKHGWLIYNFGKDIESIDGETGEIKNWQGEEKISKLKNIMNYPNVFVTKKVEEQTGEFYNQTLYSPKSKKPVPTISQNKNLQVERYGGYSGIQQSFYSIIEYKKGKKITRELVGVPIMYAKNSDEKEIVEYFEKLTGGREIRFLVKKINKYQRINYENNLFGIVASKEVNNGKQLFLNYQEQTLLSEIRGLVPKTKDETQKEKEEKQNLSGIELYNILIEKMKIEYPCFISIKKKLEEARTGYNELPIVNKGTNIDKNNFINEILKVLSVGSTNGNFKKFSHISNLTEREGRLTKTLQPNEIEFINTSITGMREKRYTLKDLEV